MTTQKTIGTLIVLISIIFIFSIGVSKLMGGNDPKEAIVWIVTAIFIPLLMNMIDSLKKGATE